MTRRFRRSCRKRLTFGPAHTLRTQPLHRLLLRWTMVLLAISGGLLSPLLAAAQASSSDAAALLGTFTVVISIPDVQRDIPNGPALYGRWQISFRSDGSYAADRADLTGDLVVGSFAVDGDQLTVTDEDGLLSCSNASIIGTLPDAAVGVYRWQRIEDRLSLTPIEDNCAGRRILFSTRQLTGFSPCATQPLVLPTDGSPVTTESTPVPVLPTITPTPTESDPSLDASGSPSATDPVTAAIDALLSQMTSCWATGQPEYFLPLMTTEFRSQFLQSSSSADPVAELATLMASTPFVWQRSGDVDQTDATHAVALVRQAVNNQEDFVRYAFALEDGEWRWNGAG